MNQVCIVIGVEFLGGRIENGRLGRRVTCVAKVTLFKVSSHIKTILLIFMVNLCRVVIVARGAAAL